MDKISSNSDHEPEICLYENLEELQIALGQPFTHGLFDAQKNQIHATRDSIAHEIAHFKDRKSGRMQNLKSQKTAGERNAAAIRNELVAILYSWKKNPNWSSYLPHEQEFLELFLYDEKRTPSQLSFPEIQNCAENWACRSHPFFPRLRFIFRHYLEEEI